MTATLSLYKLDAELTDLLDLREQLLDESLPGDADLTGVDGAIRAYMEQLPRKVDGVAHVLRHFAEQVDFADREIKRLTERKRQAKENAQRLKDYAAAVLEKLPAPEDGTSRKLKGNCSTIYLKKNGSVQPLVIAQPELVPRELHTQTVTVNAATWDEFAAVIVSDEKSRLALSRMIASRSFQGTRVPSSSLIREALIQPCATCDGAGDLEFVKHSDNGGPSYDYTKQCQACGGTGKNAVPGAHLEPRGQHVEVK